MDKKLVTYRAAECYFHRVSLNFTLSWKICSGVFNVTSFRGAEMDQVLRKMEARRQQYVALHVTSLPDGANMRRLTLEKESPDLSVFDYCQLSPDLMLILQSFNSAEGCSH